MSEEPELRRWVEGYRAAWESNDPAAIGELFAADGVYVPEPYSEPWVGREAIVAGWLEHADGPGDANFAWEVRARTGELWVVSARTEYSGLGRSYRNLWLVELDGDGRARRFEEWWMREPE